MLGRVFFGIAFIVALAASAAAGPISHRQARQAGRIHQGIVTGELTPRETTRLAAEQRAIAAEERRYRRNGMQPWEWRDLQRDLDRSSQHIWQQSHDGQFRR